MNFFNRSIISIKRVLTKSFILLILVFILGIVANGALTINNAINTIDDNLRARMRPIVSLSFDYGAFRDSVECEEVDCHFLYRPTFVTLKELYQIADLEQVKSYDFMIRAFINSFEFMNYIPMGYIDNAWRAENILQSFDLRGTSTTNMIQIDQGIIEIVAGRQFNQDDFRLEAEHIPVIVSERFALLNNLGVNSVFEMYNIIPTPTNPNDWSFNPNWFLEPYRYDKLVITFEIIGMFDLPFQDDIDDPWNDYSTNRINDFNSFYVPNKAVEVINNIRVEAIISSWENSDYDYKEEPQLHSTIVWEISRNEQIHSLFVINDFHDIEKFRQKVVYLLPEFYSVEDLSNTFVNLESSMISIQELANLVLFGTFLALFLIISLLLLLFVRDRRHELGVYLALGEKKIKILAQILTEIAIISFIGISFSMILGNFITSQISRNMLFSELTAIRNDEEHFNQGNVMDIFGVPIHEMPINDIVDSFDLSLNINTVVILYFYGIIVSMISTAIPIGYYIVKLKPRELLE